MSCEFASLGVHYSCYFAYIYIYGTSEHRNIGTWEHELLLIMRNVCRVVCSRVRVCVFVCIFVIVSKTLFWVFVIKEKYRTIYVPVARSSLECRVRRAVDTRWMEFSIFFPSMKFIFAIYMRLFYNTLSVIRYSNDDKHSLCVYAAVVFMNFNRVLYEFERYYGCNSTAQSR